MVELVAYGMTAAAIVLSVAYMVWHLVGTITTLTSLFWPIWLPVWLLWRGVPWLLLEGVPKLLTKQIPKLAREVADDLRNLP